MCELENCGSSYNAQLSICRHVNRDIPSWHGKIHNLRNPGVLPTAAGAIPFPLDRIRVCAEFTEGGGV